MSFCVESHQADTWKHWKTMQRMLWVAVDCKMSATYSLDQCIHHQCILYIWKADWLIQQELFFSFFLFFFLFLYSFVVFSLLPQVIFYQSISSKPLLYLIVDIGFFTESLSVCQCLSFPAFISYYGSLYDTALNFYDIHPIHWSVK